METVLQLEHVKKEFQGVKELSNRAINLYKEDEHTIGQKNAEA